jgi:DNA polymerase-3 subunit gamma/tau
LVSEPVKKIRIKERKNRVSGLSISSLKAKKEHRNIKKNNEVEEADLPTETFTEEEMQQYWSVFVQGLDKDGRKILASSLNTDLPKLLDKGTIWIELPNNTMKKEIEREQNELMSFLKKSLNNYSIKLKITVNEETAKKFAFTPEEKYKKLREKNPAIDLLRKTFDLDL